MELHYPLTLHCILGIISKFYVYIWVILWKNVEQLSSLCHLVGCVTFQVPFITGSSASIKERHECTIIFKLWCKFTQLYLYCHSNCLRIYFSFLSLWTLRRKMAILMVYIAFELTHISLCPNFFPSPWLSTFLITFHLPLIVLLTRSKLSSATPPPSLLDLESLRVSCWM